MSNAKRTVLPELSRDQIEDLRLAASQMSGAKRRAFQAEMALKYCGGSARRAKTLFGWSREAVALGLAEKRTGLICYSAHSANSGRPRWEEKQPEAAQVLLKLAEAHAQQDPTFDTTLAYTRLTAAAALKALSEHGFAAHQLPAPSTMADVLNRQGYRLRQVVKAKLGIPVISTTHSGRNRPLIPEQIVQSFRNKSTTHSAANRPVIPVDSVQ